MFAPYARFEVVVIALLGAVVTVPVGVFWGPWALLPGVLTAALLAFYRDPPRRAPVDDRVLVAPADGRILSIERERDAGAGRRELRICIFLSVLDVHLNRSPCAGRVVGIQYTRGRFINALKREATDVNESRTLTLEPRPPLPGPIHVRQIAGAIARRIVCAVEPGDELTLGQRFGMIKLGSQTQLRVPEDPLWELPIRVGERVKGGVTVLARLPRES